MKLKVLFSGLFIAGLAMTSIAEAQTQTPVINHRQDNQRKRINQGVKSGELTHSEAHKLRTNEKKVTAEKRAAKADGKVTRKERTAIRRQENRNSKAIYKKKHNDKVN